MWKLLFATDGSDDADAALAFLQALPLPPGSEVRVLHVVPPPAHTFQEGWRAYGLLESTERERAESLVRRTCEQLARTGVDVEGQALTGDPAAEILEGARRFGSNLVVVGSRGLTGLKSFFLGSVARNVAQHAPCSVLVARRPAAGLRQVLVATDGSANAERAVEVAAALPLPAEARFAAVCVVRPYTPIPPAMPADAAILGDVVIEIRQQQQADAQALAEAAAARLRAAGRAAEPHVATGDPAEEICLLAEQEGADLICAGARGASFIEGLVLGSVAERLLGRAHCSVLVAR